MINDLELAIAFKTYLTQELISRPDLAEFACLSLWNRLDEDIRAVMPQQESDRYIAVVEINQTVYQALVLDFPKNNLLCEVQHLQKLEEICRINHEVTGLNHVAAIHKKHGVMAEIVPNSEVKYILWSF